jgi:excisionase family DNA binding protein
MTGRLLTVEEVADRLQVPVRTIYGWRSRQEGPPGFRVGKHIRFSEEDLDAWLETRRDVFPRPAFGARAGSSQSRSSARR